MLIDIYINFIYEIYIKFIYKMYLTFDSLIAIWNLQSKRYDGCNGILFLFKNCLQNAHMPQFWSRTPKDSFAKDFLECFLNLKEKTIGIQIIPFLLDMTKEAPGLGGFWRASSVHEGSQPSRTLPAYGRICRQDNRRKTESEHRLAQTGSLKHPQTLSFES